MSTAVELVGEIDSNEWRDVPDFPGYQMNSDVSDLQVWSMPRQVPGKGGSLRQIRAKQIKVATDGRVCLSYDGRKKSFHPLRDLYPIVFPDLVKQQRRDALQRQAVCRNRHPLMEPIDVDAWRCLAPRMFGYPAPITPKLTYWGTNNRICRWCDAPSDVSVDYIYTPEYGIYRGAVSSLPATPEVPDREEAWQPLHSNGD
jgi:hypothetical protein